MNDKINYLIYFNLIKYHFSKNTCKNLSTVNINNNIIIIIIIIINVIIINSLLEQLT